MVVQVAAHVTDEVCSNTPLHEAPVPVAALEAILISTA
jgi:hypothetical protein